MGAASPIGVLGGTFDPIHLGHLRLAEEVADACRLARVLVMPAALPNLRDAPRTPALHRAAMARLAIEGNPRLALDARELSRPGMSYTVDTMRELRAELGDAAPIVFMLGADAFARLPAWDRWREMFDLAHIAVATRPGQSIEASALAPELGSELSRRGRNPAELAVSPAGGVGVVPIPLLEVSATVLRERLARGASVRYLLPEAVVAYIRSHSLYRVDA